MKYECIFAEDKNIGTVLLPTVHGAAWAMNDAEVKAALTRAATLVPL